ncbi:hypothetical protein [uncultured Roseobacter sp.]|uniref:hypothetical protein n=1 Tax=uncultured Roseobacter sp. TaxID=114847 RepID=UPI002630DDDE|nr:hypothetical protein [uncultured Roseobacter sp.]
MTMSARLNDLRARFPGCAIAVFADLSTGMVLVSSTTERVGQETFDALCRDGGRCFAPDMPDVFNARGHGQTVAGAWYAVSRFHDKTACHVRSPVLGEEALCFLCEEGCDIDGLVNAARTVLTETGVDA